MKKLLIVSSLVVLLSGCQESAENNGQSEDAKTETEELEVKAPKVEIIADEHVNKNEEVSIVAKVYYGGNLVDDAEVTFEIKSETKESEKIDAEFIDDGQYKISYQFKEDGLYDVTAHTNVKSYHTMPTKTIQVGEGTSKESTHHENTSNENHDHADEHHQSTVNITTEELREFTVNSEEELRTIINKNDTPFTDAKVRFEIWKEGNDHHHFIDANESSSKGTYLSKFTFEEVGAYHIIVHVEKAEVHDHVEIVADVK
ncbi:FixH family protein [Metabacillus litoralis]|uniref:FixH family protein n=1 Tax=Metabacillus litoralis TaxID=152268 RepID=UPI001CFDDEB6|nr:FixH family protein [Metabacillus litoralis]